MDVATWYPLIAMICTGFVLGGMAFFSFVLAPLVFRQLEREQAAAFMRAAFPLYYQSMGVGAIVAGDADADARFKRLHGFSMAVNLVQLAAVVVVMARLGL